MQDTDKTQLNPEWKALDFQQDVRPAQLKKLAGHKDEIADIARKIDENNNSNLQQIDSLYKETAELEGHFISKKMTNMNLINDMEKNSLEFLNQMGETNRETESLNSQINSIQRVLALLNNEATLAENETTNMKAVFKSEIDFLATRDKMMKENDNRVLGDLADQKGNTKNQVINMGSTKIRQTTILDGLTAQQKVVV